MIFRALVLSLLSCAATFPCLGQPSSTPLFVGMITHVSSASEFDVNGLHLHVAEPGMIVTRAKFGLDPKPSFVEPYLGGTAEVYGRLDKSSKTIEVSRVAIEPQMLGTVTGSGVIDAVVQAARPGEPLIVRADGYPILIGNGTKIHFKRPLNASTPISANLWIAFHGRQRADGVVVAEAAVLNANTISDGQSRLLDRVAYDPEAVAPGAHQGGLSKRILGYDPRLEPPDPDQAMQKRVRTIGESLVPRYQRELPDTDDTKIDFRFEVIDEPWLTAVALPSGVILVPRVLVERLKDDSQLAAVLALNIAVTLEKQNLHVSLPKKVQIPADAAATAAFAGLAGTSIELASGSRAGISSEPDPEKRKQNERVSLCLLHDAGYDIQQAPVAWWLLASKEPKEMTAIKMPERSAYLYRILGTTWANR